MLHGCETETYVDNFVLQDSPFHGIIRWLIFFFFLDNLFKSMAQQILFPQWTLPWKRNLSFRVWLFF